MGKRFGLCALLMIMLLVLSACGVESKYNNALELMSKGNYAKAAKTLESISDYEDAADMAVYCNACAIAEKGDYATAVSMLKSISHFKDSSVRATYYNGRAYEQYAGTENMEYLIKALNSYSTTPAFLDCTERATAMEMRIENIKKAQYDAAVEAGENGQYEIAEEAFTELGSFSDSVSRITYYEAREYEQYAGTDNLAYMLEAYNIYTTLESFLDSAQRADAMEMRIEATRQEKYEAAVNAGESGQYAAAVDRFSELIDYSDSVARITYYHIRENESNLAADANQDMFIDVSQQYVDMGDYLDCSERANALQAKANAVVQTKCAQIDALIDAGLYEDATSILAEFGTYGSEMIKEKYYKVAEEYAKTGQWVKASTAFKRACPYKDALKRAYEIEYRYLLRNRLAVGLSFTAGLKEDGTVITTGTIGFNKIDVSSWTDIIAIAAGEDHLVGLKSDGTVVAVGRNDYGFCDVEEWTDIVAIAACGESNRACTIGLRADGTVLMLGKNNDGRCDVSGWTDIVAVGAGDYHTVGVKADGTVVAVGGNDDGCCEVSGWTDIVYISVGDDQTAGLKSNGAVVHAGSNGRGAGNVAEWTDIVSVIVGSNSLYPSTVGLKADGTVVAVGYHADELKLARWTDIVSIARGGFDAGLKSDGTVVVHGGWGSETRVGDWDLLEAPKQYVQVPAVQTEQDAASQPVATPRVTTTSQPVVTPSPQQTAAPTKKATATPKPTAMPTKKATATPKPTAVPTKRATATPKPTAMPKALRIGDIVTMGTYEQDNRKNNGTEAIEWQVIDIQGNKALLISRYVLDHVDYHTKQTSVTWESCYMRRWLNSEFIQTAFNANEQEMILTTIVKAQKNPHLSTEPKNGIGNDTQDKIFLLNVVEAEKYFDSDWDRQCKGTEYALDQNVSTDGVYCNWLLRQPHKFGTTVPCVNFEGSTNDGVNVSAERTGMRPAMWIDVNLLPGYSSIGK